MNLGVEETLLVNIGIKRRILVDISVGEIILEMTGARDLW